MDGITGWIVNRWNNWMGGEWMDSGRIDNWMDSGWMNNWMDRGWME